MPVSESTIPSPIEPQVTVWIERDPRPTTRQYLIAVALFLATLFTTLVIGVRLEFNYQHALAPFSDSDTSLPFFPISYIAEHPSRLMSGLPFAVAVMGILLAHELGHYIYCRRYRVDATPPYFIPAPTLIGTMGAFIMIRSAFPTRRSLFDIGIAGPIAGFVLTVPISALGFYLSYPVAQTPDSAAALGLPLMFHGFEAVLIALGIHGHAPLGNYILHPLAVAGWTGGFATALNLLPGGQLDGGHIVFSWSPRAHRMISSIAIGAMVMLSYYFWIGWLLWGVVLFFTGMRRPVIYDERKPLGSRRGWLTALAAAMLLVSINVAPIEKSGLIDNVAEWKHDLRQLFVDFAKRK